MPRTRLILFISLGIIVAGLGAAAAWLAANEDRIAQALLKTIERGLKTDAHIEQIHLDMWSQFPHVSVIIEDAWLMDSGASADTLLRAQQIQLACNAWALWNDNYELKELDISDARILLREDERGQWNTDVWHFDDAESTGKTASITIEQLRLSSVALTLGSMSCQIEDATVQLAESDTAFTLDGSGKLTAFSSPEFNTQSAITWAGKGTWNMDKKTVALSLSEVKWMGSNASISGNDNQGEWTLEGKVSRLDLPTLQALVPLPDPWNSMKNDAAVSGSFSWEADVFKSNWDLAQHPWEIPLEEGSFRCLVGGSVWLKYENGGWRADVPRASVAAKGLTWNGRVENIQFYAATYAAIGIGEIDWSVCDLRALGNYDWPTAGQLSWDGTWAQRRAGTPSIEAQWQLTDGAGSWDGVSWSLSASGSANPQKLSIHALNGSWDGIRFDGQVNVASWLDLAQAGTGTTSTLSGSVHLPVFEITETDAAAKANENFLESVQLASGFAVNCAVAVDSIRYAGWDLSEASFQLVGDEASWSVPRWSAQTLDGQLSGDATCQFNPQRQTATLQIHPSARSCDLQALFTSFDNFDQSTLRAEHLSGTFDANGSVRFEVNQAGLWKPETLDILGSAEINEGALVGLEAFEEIAEYLRQNRIMAPLVDPDDLSQRLADVQFDRLESPIYVSQGIVRIPNIQIRSSAMNISLQGNYGFDESIDYTLGFALRDLRTSQDSEFGPIEDDGLGQQFFISMDGTFENPTYSWDRDAQKNHRKENFQREKELLKELFRKSNP